MNVQTVRGAIGDVQAEVVVVPVYEGEQATRRPLKDVDRTAGGHIAAAISSGEFKAKVFETSLWPGNGAGRVLLVGAGPKAKADAAVMRRVYGAAARAVRDKFSSVALLLRSDAHAESAVDGFSEGDFEPDLYRTERKTSKVQTVTVVGAGDMRRQTEEGRVLGGAVNLCRTLVTMPPNELTPRALADRATAELTEVGVKVEVLRGKAIQRMGGLLGVAQGSSEAPQFITMAWEPARAKRAPVLGLVGKGVTFDSGGLSLKPAQSMDWMKGDMAGAAAVISAMRAIAELKVPVRVLAACPATENMPSGTATRVGDVLRMYSGKTAEVLNTDAEGRLILADALAWLAERGVTHMVDAATLTGAMEIALGNVAFGVMGNADAWVDRVVASARRSGERAWPLPLYDEYREQIKSEVADVKNIGGRPGGAITAGWFLREFVPDELPWAHMDIAGVAWGDAKPWRAKGATGAGVRTFVRLAQDLAARA
ncbi:MAG TPA: leucyl aminopeptidase [Actinomycetota bacterium]|nr:leucyl aminopeptidase [Actinomycetota bacterium]